MKKSKSVYVNPVQDKFLQAPQQDKTFVGGRGVGKSSLIGFSSYLSVNHLPRAKQFFVSTTYNQILTKTMPAIEAMWQSFGLKEWQSEKIPGHYIVGRRPPKNWTRPYSPPRRFDNVISFWNGYCIEFLSMDRPDHQRGGSYDGGFGDEINLVKKEHINKVLLPSIRGNRHKYTSHLHQQFSKFCSMPWKRSQYWVLEYAEKMNLHPDEYYYQEATAYDNIEVLGEKGIERLRRELTYLEFQVEVMNMRITRQPEGFYHAFSEDKHGYQPKYNYGDSNRGIITRGTADMDPKQPMDISLDFSGWINCMTVYQSSGKEEKMVDALFVKDPKSVKDLIDDYCNKYVDHKNKTVRVWGEPRGHDKNPMGITFFNVVKNQFRKHGWNCEIKAHAGRTNNHEDRYILINNIFAEDDSQLPRLRINQENCKDPIIALQITQVTADNKKNKSKEKDRTFPQEHAPHFTDTIDYYFMQKYGQSRLILGLPGTVHF